jgi:hypothetical protein
MSGQQLREWTLREIAQGARLRDCTMDTLTIDLTCLFLFGYFLDSSERENGVCQAPTLPNKSGAQG